MKKIIILMSVVLLITGCSNSSFANSYNNNKKIVEETNSFGLTTKEQLVEDQKMTADIEFTGMDTIWIYEAEEDVEIDMTYLLNVSKGKVKLVLIAPDDTITTVVEVTDESELKDYATSTLLIKKGLNRIKLVAGKDTQVSFELDIEAGEFQELGM